MKRGASGYSRYIERVEDLRSKGYYVKEESIYNERQYRTLAQISKMEGSKNIPRDLARTSARWTPKQIRALSKLTGLKNKEIRGMSFSGGGGSGGGGISELLPKNADGTYIANWGS